MIFGRWMRRRKRVGFAPALLVLLLSVRVATAAAVDCQHELADAAQAHHHAQDLLKIEAIALGGALCLVEENPGALVAPPAEAKHDSPHLNTPCPFFKSPVVLMDVTIALIAREHSFSRVVRVYDDMRAAVDDLPIAYSPRAPPVVAVV
ncbi:hypothetical protein KZZ08_14630 [Roseovarius mucosus]|nr:hypothetical protein [Roseovarius mucosus]